MAERRPCLVGLTGSIGMGKTETAHLFERLGVPVFDADATVHRLYERGGAAVDDIGSAFPGSVIDGQVDRVALSKIIGASKEKLGQLERIVHPRVAQEQDDFIAAAAVAGAEIVVLDIPLLFETGKHASMDFVVVVSAPADVQRARVLGRAGMTVDKLDHLLSRQMPDAEKRGQADFIVETDKGLDDAFEQVKQIIATLRARRPREQNLA